VLIVVFAVTVVDVAPACNADSSGHSILAIDALLDPICSLLDWGNRAVRYKALYPVDVHDYHGVPKHASVAVKKLE